jgi:protein TonB
MALELPFHFSFRAKPPSVRPDLFLPPALPPRWLTAPSNDEFARAYPTHAARAGLGGRTDMTCRVDDSGGMEACKIDDETPPGLGFGAAALKLSRYFKMSTSTGDGFPMLGATIAIPIVWKLRT